MQDMHAAHAAPGRIGQLKLFIASLWLTLATALFFAVVPAELPLGAAQGSAFNPANNVVAVHSGAGTNRALLKRIADKDPAATVDDSGLFLPVETAPLAAPSVAQALAAAAAPTILALGHGRNLHYARGPPAA